MRNFVTRIALEQSRKCNSSPRRTLILETDSFCIFVNFLFTPLTPQVFYAAKYVLVSKERNILIGSSRFLHEKQTLLVGVS